MTRPRSLRPRLLTLALALAAALGGVTALPGEDSADAAIAAFKSAMGGQDSDAKRAAIRALASKGVGSDDVVLPLLVSAVADRQGNDAAITALRARTGLAPPAYVGQSHYPAYPSSDDPSAWQQWLSERSRDKELDKKVKDLDKKAHEKDKPATAPAPADESSAPAAPAPALPPPPPPTDLGPISRVVFKNGSTLLCYILTRRTDADGHLISIRVAHPDGAGEETLTADMISRIDDDARR
jgi:hypothetical protein